MQQRHRICTGYRVCLCRLPKDGSCLGWEGEGQGEGRKCWVGRLSPCLGSTWASPPTGTCRGGFRPASCCRHCGLFLPRLVVVVLGHVVPQRHHALQGHPTVSIHVRQRGAILVQGHLSTMPTCFSRLLSSGSASACFSIRKNGSTSAAVSGSSVNSRRRFSVEMGLMTSCQIRRRCSSYWSRIEPSARPRWMPTRLSYRLPTSAMPPVSPSPPLCVDVPWRVAGEPYRPPPPRRRALGQ
ncbi:hypothetical protein VTK73DRAFT_6298 [Phialemonium thermophilum]|uniref:Uncharacterized protein n=1 Tax=Phialemonium thermophilum TaxID=223376 RepID=A0ABR3UZV6_9PEZI